MNISTPSMDLHRCFGGVARLYSDAGLSKLRNSAAAVVGLGGVGSWAAEALVRTSVGKIYLIDLDNVAESNTNRQIQAMDGEYGKPKVQALMERFRRINPACEIVCIEEMVDEENVEEIIPKDCVVLDCIDQVKAKAAILACAKRRSQTVITSGAAGGRRNPLRIQTGDLARIKGDPLLSRVRHNLRKSYGFAAAKSGKNAEKFGIQAVFSDEPVVRSQSVCEVQSSEGLSCAGFGSGVTVTAPMGMVCASLAIEAILNK